MKTADGTTTYREFLDSEYFEHMMEKNVERYRHQFLRIIQKAKVEDYPLDDKEALSKIAGISNFNWAAFLFSTYWGAYRRLKEGWIGLVMLALVSLIIPYAIDSTLSGLLFEFFAYGLVMFEFGRRGDSWLLRDCVDRINNVKSLGARRRVSYAALVSMIFIVSVYSYIISQVLNNGVDFESSDIVDVSEDIRVQIVKSGSFHQCPGITVEQMVNGYMAAPSWRAFSSDDGENVVNIKGDIGVSYSDKVARVLMQFLVDKKQNSFELHYFEVNGEGKAHLLATELIVAMCDSVKSGRGQQNNKVKSSEKTVDVVGIGNTVSTGFFKIIVNEVETTGSISDSAAQLEEYWDTLLFMSDPDEYVFGLTGMMAKENRERRNARTRASEGNIYVVIGYLIENIAKEPISYSSLPELTLIDEEGYEFFVDEDATYRLEDVMGVSDDLADINPLTPIQKVAVFNVPEDRYQTAEWLVRFESGGLFAPYVDVSLSPDKKPEHTAANSVPNRETKRNPLHEQGHILARSKKYGLEVVASEKDGVWCDEEIQLYFNAEDNDFFSDNVFNMIKTIGDKVLPHECPRANTIMVQGFVSGSDVILFEGAASEQDAWSVTQLLAQAKSQEAQHVSADYEAGQQAWEAGNMEEAASQ